MARLDITHRAKRIVVGIDVSSTLLSPTLGCYASLSASLNLRMEKFTAAKEPGALTMLLAKQREVPMPKATSSVAPPKSTSPSKPADKRSPSSKPLSQTNADPIALLERDHREVAQFFAEFEAASGDAQKRKIANAICIALKVHARLEEELFYPAAATVLGNPSLIQEAIVEHAAAKDLIAQIETGAPGEAYYDARVKVLAEYIQHHVAEEEGEIFPKVRSSDLNLDALGQQMAMRKHELMLGFIVSNPVLGLV